MNKLPTSYKSKPRLCPVCGKRKLFANYMNPSILECANCRYRHGSVAEFIGDGKS